MHNLLLLPIAFAGLNLLRGKSSWLAHMYGASFAAVLFVNTWQWQAWFAYLAFILGESFGWGKLFGLMRYGDRRDREIGRMCLFVRAVIWWAPVLLVMAWCGCNLLGCAFGGYGLALAFPLAVQHAPNYLPAGGWWKVQEIIYGAVQGLVIGAILTWW